MRVCAEELGHQKRRPPFFALFPDYIDYLMWDCLDVVL